MKNTLEPNQLSLFPEPEHVSNWCILWNLYGFPEPAIGDIIAIGCCIAELLEPEDPEFTHTYLYWQLCIITEIRNDGKVICEFKYNFSPDNPWIYEKMLGKKIILDREDVCIPFPQVEFLLGLHEKGEISIRKEYRQAMLGWENEGEEEE
ncbi:MAG: hypothetical protein SH817_08470 [Leptospira sp.]|nr:hypothetical protein [Leptospira sp.]